MQLLHPQSERYGLSFIKLHSPPEPAEVTPTSATPTPMPASSAVPIKLGGFSLKEETGDLPSGSLFFKRGPLSSPPPPPGRGKGAGGSSDCPNAAAQARMASAAALRGIASSSSSSSSSPGSAQGPKVGTSPMASHPHKTTSPVSAHHSRKMASPASTCSPKAGPSDDGGTSKGGGGAGGGGNKRPMTTAHAGTPDSKKRPKGEGE